MAVKVTCDQCGNDMSPQEYIDHGMADVVRDPLKHVHLQGWLQGDFCTPTCLQTWLRTHLFDRPAGYR